MKQLPCAMKTAKAALTSEKELRSFEKCFSKKKLEKFVTQVFSGKVREAHASGPEKEDGDRVLEDHQPASDAATASRSPPAGAAPEGQKKELASHVAEQTSSENKPQTTSSPTSTTVGDSPTGAFPRTPVNDLTWKSLSTQLFNSKEADLSAATVIIELYHRDRDRKFEREAIYHTAALVFEELERLEIGSKPTGATSQILDGSAVVLGKKKSSLRFFRYDISENYVSPEIFGEKYHKLFGETSIGRKTEATEQGAVFLFHGIENTPARTAGDRNTLTTASKINSLASLRRGPPAVFPLSFSGKEPRALLEGLVKWIHKKTTTSSYPATASRAASAKNQLRDALDLVKDFEPEILARAKTADDNERRQKKEKQAAIDKMMKTLKQEKGLYDIRDSAFMSAASGNANGAGSATGGSGGEPTETKAPPLKQFRDRGGVKDDKKGKKMKPKKARKQGPTKRSKELRARAAAAERRAEEAIEKQKKGREEKLQRRKEVVASPSAAARHTVPSAPKIMKKDHVAPEEMIHTVSWGQTKDTLHLTLHFSSNFKSCVTEHLLKQGEKNKNTNPRKFFDAVTVKIAEEQDAVVIEAELDDDEDEQASAASVSSRTTTLSCAGNNMTPVAFRTTTRLNLREFVRKETLELAFQGQQTRDATASTSVTAPTATVEAQAILTVRKKIPHRWDRLLDTCSAKKGKAFFETACKTTSSFQRQHSEKNYRSSSTSMPFRLKKDWVKEDPNLEEEEDVELPKCKDLKPITGSQLELIFERGSADHVARPSIASTTALQPSSNETSSEKSSAVFPRMLVLLVRHPWCRACEEKDREIVNFVKWKSSELPANLVKFAVLDAREYKNVASRFLQDHSAASADENFSGGNLPVLSACDATCPLHVFKREEGLDKFYVLPAKKWHEEYLLDMYQYAVPLVTLFNQELKQDAEENFNREKAFHQWRTAFHTGIVAYFPPGVVDLDEKDIQANTTDVKAHDIAAQNGTVIEGGKNTINTTSSATRTSPLWEKSANTIWLDFLTTARALRGKALFSATNDLRMVHNAAEGNEMNAVADGTATASSPRDSVSSSHDETSRQVQIYVFKSAENRAVKYPTPEQLTAEKLTEFSKRLAVPLVSNFDFHSRQQLAELKMPIGLLWVQNQDENIDTALAKQELERKGGSAKKVNDNYTGAASSGSVSEDDSGEEMNYRSEEEDVDETTTAVEIVEKLARKFEGKMAFAKLNVTTEGIYMREFGFHPARSLPAFGIVNTVDALTGGAPGGMQGMPGLEGTKSSLALDGGARYAFAERVTQGSEQKLAQFVDTYLHDQQKLSKAFRTNELSAKYEWLANRGQVQETVWSRLWEDLGWWSETKKDSHVLFELYAPNRPQHSTHMLLVNLLAVALKKVQGFKIVRMDTENNHVPEEFKKPSFASSSSSKNKHLRSEKQHNSAPGANIFDTASGQAPAATEYFFLDTKARKVTRFKSFQSAKLLDLPVKLLQFVKTQLEKGVEGLERTAHVQQDETAETEDEKETSKIAEINEEPSKFASGNAAHVARAQVEELSTADYEEREEADEHREVDEPRLLTSNPMMIGSTSGAVAMLSPSSLFSEHGHFKPEPLPVVFSAAKEFVKREVREKVRKMKRIEREREKKHHEAWAQYEIEEFLRYERKGYDLHGAAGMAGSLGNLAAGMGGGKNGGGGGGGGGRKSKD
ncbi:unnamed protein product [Amoebophrya sp. A120]|nr:unnamed protein product [Amoebophrya sp. A120]|eukprot:GSA120T00007841001.1